MHWYVSALRVVRAALGYPIRALVFSEARDADLAPILSEPSTFRAPYLSAIADLLTTAQAAVLISSRSSYCMWISFLGQVPTVYFPGARPCPTSMVCNDSAPYELEPEWYPGDVLSSNFVRAVDSRVRFREALESPAP
jgi:hypothetical protein